MSLGQLSLLYFGVGLCGPIWESILLDLSRAFYKDITRAHSIAVSCGLFFINSPSGVDGTAGRTRKYPVHAVKSRSLIWGWALLAAVDLYLR